MERKELVSYSMVLILIEPGSTGGSFRGANMPHDFYSFERAEDIFKNFFGGRDPFADFFDDEDDFFSFGFSGMGGKKKSNGSQQRSQQ